MSTEITDTTIEEVDEIGEDPAAIAKRWLIELNLSKKEFRDWTKQGKEIVRRYRDDRRINDNLTNRKANRFNIFWSNVQTLQPALYSRTPSPEVSRRYNDKDPVARAASEILERCLEYSLDVYDFDKVMEAVRDDNLLVGRGTAWIRYIPHIEEVTPPAVKVEKLWQISPDTGEEEYQLINENGEFVEDESLVQEGDDGLFIQEEPFDEITYEEVVCDYVNWDNFYHSPARRWSEVRWVARQVFMTRAELSKRFGAKGKKVNLNILPKGFKDNDELGVDHELFKQASVWEIWNKDDKKVYWISEGLEGEPLDVKDDFLGLKNFFPCPEPLYATTTTDTLVPVPDLREYDGQAKELDNLTSRISVLTEVLRVTGVYDESLQGIDQLLSSDSENALIPVANWQSFAQSGGFNGAVDFFPMADVAKTLTDLHALRAQVKADIFEITGLSDIIRGQGDPRETATAQGIKSKFASLRLSARQRDIQRFARDLISLKAEVISEHFSEDTIAMIANTAFEGSETPGLFEAAVELLRNDATRTFRIDIETDSTVELDSQVDKQDTIEFVNAVTGYIREASIVSESAPNFVPAFGEMLMMSVRQFKAGRGVETSLQQAVDQSTQQAKQQQQQPQESPESQQAAADRTKAMIELQQQSQKDQAQLQLEQAKAQGKLQIEQQKVAGKLAIEEEKTARELAIEEAKTERELQIKEAKAIADAELAQQKVFLSQLQ